MPRISDLRETPEVPDEIKQAGLNGELVLFIGAGVSRLVDLPSWAELAWKALSQLQKEGCLNYSELEQLSKLSPKIQLSIAEQIANDNSLPFDLVQHLKLPSNGEGIYSYINSIGCPCVTTNYDELLSPIPPTQS